MNMEEE